VSYKKLLLLLKKGKLIRLALASFGVSLGARGGRSFGDLASKALSALPQNPPSNLDWMAKNDSMQNMLALISNIFIHKPYV
jgi:hypothetical protein